MKPSMKNFLNIVIVVAWCILILSFSSDNAVKSDIKSTLVVDTVKPAVVSVTDTIGIRKPTDDELQHFVRKSAHFLCYLILGVLFFNMYKGFGIKIDKLALLSILSCFIFACFDEFYQTFIPGRAGMFTDSLLDTTGATLGVGLLIVVSKIRRKNYGT